MSPHGSCFACTFSLPQRERVMPNLPKENKSYKHQIIELKKEKRKEDLLKMLWQYVYSTYVVQFN